MLLFCRWQVRGSGNIPEYGQLLIVANHLHIADPPIIGVSISRKTRFMAKEELFRSRFTSYFVSGFGAFPVNRGRIDRPALRQAEQILNEGMGLVMFPESRRSRDARLQTAYPGSALIALHSRAPILPVAITGTEKIKGAAWWLRRPRITVTIGQPFQLPEVNGRITKEVLIKMTDITMNHIAELLPVEYRGKYAAKAS